MRSWALILCCLIVGTLVMGQNSPSESLSLPHIIRYSGTLPLTIPASQTQDSVTFRLFASPKSGPALWQETQTVPIQNGKFTALIGATTANGIPLAWFSSYQARWLEVQVGNEPPQPRIRFAGVPYAMKAGDADLFGGKPLSAFVLRGDKSSNGDVRFDATTYATLGANSFVGDQSVNGNVNVSGYVNTALATVISPLIVNQLLWVKSTATSGGVIAVKAENASSSGTGIMGIVTSATGNTVGVIGRSDSVVGNGVYGVTTSSDGSAEAISGTAKALQGHGVGGYAVNPSGANVGVYGKSYSSQGTGVVGEVSPSVNGYTTYGVVGKAHGSPGVGVFAVEDSPTGNTTALQATVASSSGTAGYFINAGSGNILIGQASTKSVFRVDGTGKVFANGGFQSGGADFAESMAVQGNRARYEPGDVLVIDADADRQITLADEPYSTRVAGVYSTKPGTLSSPHAIDSEATAQEVPVAVIGIVPCKVTTANGAIRRGDLLVTSSLPGYAMKGTDPVRFPGAIVGKALQELHAGTGVIEILVSLQ